MTAWIIVRDALLLLALAPSIYYLLAIVAAGRLCKRSAAPSTENASPVSLPPISVLKPIRGLDRETYENYASFCTQDYPEFEMLFGVTDNTDPAIPVIEKLIRDFPQRPIRLLVGAEPLGVSDKMNKVCRMAREGRHELLIVSDSDVRVSPNFLRAVAEPFRDPQVSGVTCLYRGLTDGSLAADLEAMGNGADFAPGVLAAWMLAGQRLDFMLGAVMTTTKARLAEIGGFEPLVDYFCDDYELGNRLARRGRVELCRETVAIVYPHQSIAEAFRHQLRWNLSIRYSRPWGHFGLLFAQGLFWTVLAVILAPSLWLACFFAAAYALLRVDAALAVGARGMGDPLVREKGWLLPVRDAFGFFVWLLSFFPQKIHWRGLQFRVRHKRLVPLGQQGPASGSIAGNLPRN
jgi:ceramide glucosyltransferase